VDLLHRLRMRGAPIRKLAGILGPIFHDGESIPSKLPPEKCFGHDWCVRRCAACSVQEPSLEHPGVVVQEVANWRGLADLFNTAVNARGRQSASGPAPAAAARVTSGLRSDVLAQTRA
jgi:hypothetical protein